MNVASPITDVLPGARGRVLGTLAQLETPVTVRSLAGFADVSPQAALTCVNELRAAGIVHAERAGRALLVALNRQHLAAEPVLLLATLRSRLVDRLRLELAGWPRLTAAWLFGSVARGDGGSESDVDVLLVADCEPDDPEWSAATGTLRESIRGWTGNEAELVEHTQTSLARLVAENNPLIDGLRSDGIPLTSGSAALLRESM